MKKTRKRSRSIETVAVTEPPLKRRGRPRIHPLPPEGAEDGRKTPRLKQGGRFYKSETSLKHLAEAGRAAGVKQWVDYRSQCDHPIGLLRPLFIPALKKLRMVKGFVPRVNFLSAAILAESRRKGNRPQPEGVDGRTYGIRMQVGQAAFEVVRDMPNREFAEFVSRAIDEAARNL